MAALFVVVLACGSDEAIETSTNPAVVLPAISEAMSSATTWEVRALLTVEDDSQPDAFQSLKTTINAARSGPGSNIVLTSSEAITGSISGSTSSENRIVDGTRYRRDPNSGEWTVSDAGDAAPGLTVDSDAVNQLEVSSAVVVIEEFEGEQVFHITGSIPGVDAAASVEIYAGVDDRLVRMTRLEGTAPPANFGGLLTLSDISLPQTVEARYLNYGRDITVHVPPAVDLEAGADVQTYLSTVNPYTMEISTDLKAAPRFELGGEAFSGTGGEAFFIIEEQLDVESAYVGELEGVMPDTSSYARRFEIELGVSDDFSIISNEPFTTDSGLEARLIQFTESNGAIKWMHLSYLHGEDFGFGASYGGFNARFDEIEDDILSAFRSFDIVE